MLIHPWDAAAISAMLVPSGALDPGRLLCDLNMTAFLHFARRRGCSVWSPLADWLQAAAAGPVVVSAGGWPLRLVRWPWAV